MRTLDITRMMTTIFTSALMTENRSLKLLHLVELAKMEKPSLLQVPGLRLLHSTMMVMTTEIMLHHQIYPRSLRLVGLVAAQHRLLDIQGLGLVLRL